MAEETKTPETSKASNQLALRFWSIISRFLHEGSGILSLHKAWDSDQREFLLVPSYRGQQPEALKPHVWMTWRHELKAPLGGHTFIRTYAEVVDRFAVPSLSALKAVDSEHALTEVEAARRFESGQQGLVALVLRVYQLPNGSKLYGIGEQEDDLISLPRDIPLEDLTPAIEDDVFERRRARVKAALGAGP